MALVATHASVRAGERESELVVVEVGSHPVDRRVADAAILRETGRGMVRIRRLVEIDKVTGNALRAQCGELAVAVTLAATGRGVRSGEREFRLAVIEFGSQPLRRVVAEATILGETGGGVVRILRFIEINKMTGNALRAQRGELAAAVALVAGGGSVRARERKTRS